MKNMFLALVAVWLLQPAMAQRAALGKMSSLVREAYYASQLPAATQAKPSGAAARRSAQTMVAFVKLDGDADATLTAHGCKVLARYGRLCIAEIPLAKLTDLSLDARVHRIEAGRRATAMMDTTGIVVGAVPVYQGLGLPRGYTGKGVVVGVQDIGFDLTHPNFYSTDMSRYRIGALWDQLATDTVGSTLPVGRDYVGREALLAVQHPRDGHLQTHGTHTAGTAAGSGAEGPGVVSPYRGIAYESDICMVCNATANDAELIDPADYYKYTYALDALGFKYIFDYAASVGKPCVINFSEGATEDFRGDDMLYYEMLDSLCGPGRIIVASAGNDGARINYVFKPRSQPKAGLFVGGTSSTSTVAVATTKSVGNFTMQLRLYHDVTAPVLKEVTMAQVLASPDSVFADSVVIGSSTYPIRAMAYRSSYDGGEVVCDWAVPVADGERQQGISVSVCITRAEADVEMYRTSGYFFHDSLDATLNDGDHSRSIGSPSSAPSVISVGATGYRTQFVNYLGELKVYDNGTQGMRTPFSSVGPTWDGRTKPDVMAPGQNIVSSYSTFFISNPRNAGEPLSSDVRHFDYNGRTYAWNSNGGTSMAAPVVAGIIALWLEADPTLTMDDCLDIFARTCRRYDPSLVYPNNLYGHGEIDAYEGLKLVLERTASGIKAVGTAPAADDCIYSIDGRCVGSDAAGLPRGLYIRQGRKFVVR